MNAKVDVPLRHATRLMYPRLTILLTSIDEEGNANIITLAWSMPASFKPPLAAVSIAPERYSHGLVMNSREFVVNIPTMEIAKETLFCGRNSGRDVDKFKATGLTPIPAKKVRPPLIRECMAHLECRVVDYVKAGDHTIFIGEVVSITVNDGIFDGKYAIEKIQPIFHLGGDDFTSSLKEKVTPKYPK